MHCGYRHCRKPLTQHGVGRPRQWCDNACRMAEYRIRRREHLEWLEAECARLARELSALRRSA
jgi:hypothetical protein